MPRQPKHQTTRAPSVLLVSGTYPPSGGEADVTVRDTAVNLVQRGWRVTVLTGSRAAGGQYLAGGVRVVRIASPFHVDLSRCTFPAEPLLVRVLLRLALSIYFYPALVIKALLLGPVDVVVTRSSPPFLLAIGSILGVLLDARTVHWVDALKPALRRPVAALGHGFSTMLLRRQDRIVAVGRCMEERLRERLGERTGNPLGGRPGNHAEERHAKEDHAGEHSSELSSAAQIYVVPHWPARALRPVEHRHNTLRAKRELQGTFTVMYAGPLRDAREVDPLLHAAGEINGAYPDVRFVLTGDGAGRERIAARIEEEGLENVLFLPASLDEGAVRASRGRSERLSAGDLHVVTMEKDTCGLAVPAALYGAMAVRRPCLFVGPEDSESALFLSEHGAGEAVTDADGLALRILDWYRNDVRRRIAGDRGYRAVRMLRANGLIEFEGMLRGLLPAPGFGAAGRSQVEKPSPVRAAGRSRLAGGMRVLQQ
jgi:glycosyltransferase involved in cell wall biosynthesis